LQANTAAAMTKIILRSRK